MMIEGLSDSHLAALEAIAETGDHVGTTLSQITHQIASGAPAEDILAELARMRHTLGSDLMRVQALVLTIPGS